MQIRVANRQDEPAIRTIVAQAPGESASPGALSDIMPDLFDIDAHYFWYNGVCLVAEEAGEIVGVIAGRSSRTNDADLDLLRLAVRPGMAQTEILAEEALIDTFLFFATNAGYSRVVLNPDPTACAVPDVLSDLFTGEPRHTEVSPLPLPCGRTGW